LAGNQQEAAQKQAQKQSEDPLVKIQQQELQIKQGDLQRKVTKDQTDAQLKQEQLKLEQQRQQVDAVKAVSQMKSSKEQHMMDIGVDVLKHLSNKHQDKDSKERDYLNQGLQTAMNRQTKEE
jgi:hypothetical protein